MGVVLRQVLSPVALLALASPALAQSIELKPLANARLRYERAEDAASPRTSDAVTLRLRSGIEARSGPVSVIAEAEGTLAPVNRYFDGLHARPGYPIVADPENIELNRAQVRYDWRGGSLTAGRQKIELLDQRFVGSGAFRQNEQTFDAVRMQATLAAGLSADMTFAWSQRTVFGFNGRGARQTAVSGDNVFAIVSYASPLGLVSAFHFSVDQDEAAVQGYRLSSRSSGLRLSGSHAFSNDTALSFAASWATQNNHHRNPNRYTAQYLLGEATLRHSALSVTGGFEKLGADDGRPFTSFQTPAGALIKFQGLANKFAITPSDGLHDLYATLGSTWKRHGAIKTVTLSATAHRFTSDRADRVYGHELDLIGIVGLGKWSVSARYARYDASTFGSNADRIWLAAEWQL